MSRGEQSRGVQEQEQVFYSEAVGKCRRLVSPFGPLTSNFADAQFGLALSALCGSSHGQMDTVLADHHSCQNSSSGPGVH